MDVLIEPRELAGTIEAIASKSVAHRMLILSALSEGTTELELRQSSADIKATARCLTGMGASFSGTRRGIVVIPTTRLGVRRRPRLDVGESGSTLRFLLPVLCALGCDATITCHGRLAQRPLFPLDDQLRVHGARIEWIDASTLSVSGTLEPGRFQLPGNVSSQFVSGLLMAAPLMGRETTVVVTEPVESRSYIDLTIDALRAFGVFVHEGQQTVDGRACRTYQVAGDVRLVSPGHARVEGDWSNAAFWLAAGAISGGPLTVSNLNLQSHQGDRTVMAALALFGAMVTRLGTSASSRHLTLHANRLDVSGIPDLVPPLAAIAAVAEGTSRLMNAGRLRLKESDRLQTVRDTLNALGGKASIKGDDLVIEGVSTLRGGIVDSCNDHRIAMMAAICATTAETSSIILGADSVNKSYPGFFDDFNSLGGMVTH